MLEPMWRTTNFRCPKCLSMGIVRDESVVLTSYPTQYHYKCEKCDWTGTATWEGPIHEMAAKAEVGGELSFAPQGWECPRCHRIYSPTFPMCIYCGNNETITTTTGTATTLNIKTEEKSYEVQDHD